MKDVILDTEGINSPYNGLGRFCLNLSQALLKLNEDLTFGFYSSNLKMHKGQHCRVNPLHRILPTLLPKSRIWHAMHHDCLSIPKYSDLVLTIHHLDEFCMNKSDNFINRYRRRMEGKIEHVKERGGHIVFISKFAQQQSLHYFDIPDDRMSVVYNGVTFSERTAKPSFQIPEKYFLTIGVVQKNKNFHTLVDLMELRDESLIIVGETRTAHLRRERPYANMIRKQIERKKLENRVFLVGTVNEAEKSYLIENCNAFLFPSLSEGFGIPPIESMAKGKPTFVSCKTSLPEICGTDAHYFTSFVPREMADVIEAGLRDFNESKANKMIAWTNRYSWDRAAMSYLDLYKKLQDTRQNA